MVKRVCLVSSGTGGHLWPALVLGEALRERGHDTVLITEGRRVEVELMQRAGTRAIGSFAQTLDVRGGPLGGVAGIARGAFDARRMLQAQDADAVVCTGGRTSVAAGLAGRSLRLPLALLEQNAVAGRANRLLARFADRVYLGLPPVRDLPRGMVTGTPLRPEFRSVDRAQARRKLGLRDEVPMVLVTGGSQGAGVLNAIVPDALCAVGGPLQVVHLAGPDHDDDVRRRYAPGLDGGVDAVVRSLSLDMADLYAAADLAICRGGGCTVSELIATGRPALIVPYPHHRDRQQLHNARVLARVGAARIVQQRDFDLKRVAREVRELLGDPAELKEMGRRAAGLQAHDACARIVADLEEGVLS